MKRRARFGALGVAEFARRGVERYEGRIDRRAPPIDVEAAAVKVGALRLVVVVAAHFVDLPCAGRLLGLDAFAAKFRVKDSGDGERVVADDFGVESLTRTAGEQAVLAVACEQFRGDAGGLPVRRAHHHLLDYALRVPVGHEIAREPVEQLRVARPFALRAEVIDRLHDSRAEKHRPPAVHGHTGGERLVFGDEPLCKVQPVRRFAVGARRDLREKCRRGCGDFLAVLVVCAAHFDERIARLRHLRHHHRIRDRLLDVRLRLFQIGDLLLRVGVFRRLRLAEQLLQLRLLLRSPLVRRDCRDRHRRARAQRSHFSRRERAAIQAEIIHAPREQRAGCAAPTDAERLRRFDRLRERIHDDRRLLQLPVHIHLHARALARAVVGHREMKERIRRQIALALHMNRIRRELIDEVKARLRAVKLHVPAAHISRRLHLAKRRAAPRLQSQPCRHGKRLILLKAELVAVFDPPVLLHAETVPHRALHKRPRALQRALHFLPVVARAVAIRIQRNLHHRPLGLHRLTAGHARLLPLRLLAIERLPDLLRSLVGGGDFTIEPLLLRELLRAGHLQKRLRIPVAHAVLAVLRHVVEERIHLVKILLRSRIVFVVVTLRASNRQPHPSHARRRHAVHHIEIQILRLDQPALVARHHIAMKARRHLLLDRRIWQHVARDLLDGELVERHPRIERLDHPLPPQPHVPQRIIMIPARVAVARQVQPRNRQPLAKMRRRQQLVHRRRVGSLAVRRSQQRIHLRHRRRQPRQIQRHPPQQPRRLLLRRRLQPLLRQPRLHKRIHRILRPRHLRHRHRLHRLKRPMPRPLRPLGHPAFEKFLLLRLQPFQLLRRRHHIVLVVGKNALQQLALRHIPRHHRARPRLRLAKSRLLQIQPQLPLASPRIRPVAIKARLRKNRPDIAGKINLRSNSRKRQRKQRENGKALNHGGNHGSTEAAGAGIIRAEVVSIGWAS